MASMQIIGGGTSASPGKGAAPGGLDPLLMGLSPEAAAAAGLAGEGGASSENPFVAELAAALASFEADQTSVLAENLLDPALQGGQATDLAMAAQAQGQSLPFDPAFGNAILASFAALNGAVQADSTSLAAASVAVSGVSTAEGASAALNVVATQALVGQQTIISEAALAADAAEASLAAVTKNAGQEFHQQSLSGAAGQELQAQATLTQSASSGAQKAAEAASAAASQAMGEAASGEPTLPTASQAAQIAQSANTAKKSTGPGTSVSTASGAEPGQAAQNTAALGAASNGDAAAESAVSQLQQAPKVTVKTQSGFGESDRPTLAGEQITATGSGPESESTEPVIRQTAVAGTTLNDLGNVLVTNKSNADAIAASADSARHSAQRLDGAAAGASSASAEAARAESRLEAARASLGSGPLNVEVLKLTRQGGGRAVLEVTPPNQGPIRIDLQLDGAGRASLVVEGLTDSMKARLESSAHFLRQDMASMGLALNLEMRERNDSNAQAQAFGQGQFGQSRQQDREVAAGSAQASMSGQVSGNGSGAQRPTVTDDGIHLVA